MRSFNSKTGLYFRIGEQMENKARDNQDKFNRTLKPGVRLYKQFEGFQTGRLSPEENEILQSVEIGGKLVIKPNPKQGTSRVAAFLTVYTKAEIEARTAAYEASKGSSNATESDVAGSTF